MLQKHIVTLASIIVVGVVTSYGVVVQSWVEWSTTTLVDLDKRTAIMELETKHTNQMVSQNQEMLKAILVASKKVKYGDHQESAGPTDINWKER